MSIKGPDNRMQKRVRFLILFFCVACSFVVCAKLFYMQVIQHDLWTAKASDFQTQDDIIARTEQTL